jgi:hypothetical protein
VSLNRVVGILATAFGALFLLYIFAGSTLVPPDVIGMAWWATVLRKMIAPGAILGTVLGAMCLAGGVFLLFQRSDQRPALLAIVVIGVTAALIILGCFLT